MAVKIGSDISSLQAQRRLGEASSALSTSFERLSSGLRINRASDDAAGLAIASALDAGSRIFGQAVRNLNDGISVLNIADSAMEAFTNITVRQSELAEQSANGVFSSTQRAALQKEADQLVQEFNRIVATTRFNGMQLLEPNASELRIQAGTGLNGSVAYALGSQFARAVGNGELTAGGTSADATWPESILLADLNGDGKLDAISANSTSGDIKVFTGTGSGFSGSGTSYAMGDATGLAIGDFNGDGITDVAASAYLSDVVGVRLGAGGGTFGGITNFSTGANTGPATLAAGDMNGDNILDLVSHNYDSGTVSVLLGNGNGSFGSATSYTVGAFSYGNRSPESLALVDINSDGKLDIVTAGYDVSTVTIRFNNGAGNFNSMTSVDMEGGFPRSIAFADLNRDGKLDLIAADPGANGILTRMGNGDGTFQPKTFYSTSGLDGDYVKVGDLNGDGLPDILATSDTGMRSYLNTGNGSLVSGNPLFMAANIGDVALGDVNGDGVLDVAAVLNSSTLTVAIQDTVRTMNQGLLDISSQSAARATLDSIDSTRRRISLERAGIGAALSRWEVAASAISVQRTEYIQAGSRITDADIAHETAELARRQILQQSATAVLSQINRDSAIVLKLLQV